MTTVHRWDCESYEESGWLISITHSLILSDPLGAENGAPTLSWPGSQLFPILNLASVASFIKNLWYIPYFRHITCTEGGRAVG